MPARRRSFANRRMHSSTSEKPVLPGAVAQTGSDLQGDEQAGKQPEEER